MSSVAIIGDIDTVSGFRLGGVKKAEVVAFVRKFIEETITEPNLKQKLLYNFCIS